MPTHNCGIRLRGIAAARGRWLREQTCPLRRYVIILTALAAMLAFIPLTHSVFWGTLAYTLIGGTFGGTILTLVFLPALYAIWFKITPEASDRNAVSSIRAEPIVV